MATWSICLTVWLSACLSVCAYDTIPIYCTKMASLCLRIAHTPRVQRNEKRILINKQFKMKEQENISVWGYWGWVEMQTTLTRKKHRMWTSFCSAWKIQRKMPNEYVELHCHSSIIERVCTSIRVCVSVCVEKQFHVIAIEAVSTTI